MSTGDELVVKSKLPIRFTLRPATGKVLLRFLIRQLTGDSLPNHVLPVRVARCDDTLMAQVRLRSG